MPGMRMSETITSAGAFASVSKAAAPLDENSILHSSLMSCNVRRIVCRTLSSSSTKTIRIMILPLERNRSCRDLCRIAHSDGRIDGESNKEGGTLTAFGLEAQSTSMFFNDDTVCDGEPLSGPFADFFGREEGVEDFIARRIGDPGAGI